MLSKVPSHHRRLVPLLLIVVAGLLVTLAVLAGGALARSDAHPQGHRASYAHTVCHPASRRGRYVQVVCTVGKASDHRPGHRSKSHNAKSKPAESPSKPAESPSKPTESPKTESPKTESPKPTESPKSGTESPPVSSPPAGESTPPVSSTPPTTGESPAGESPPSTSGEDPTPPEKEPSSPITSPLPAETWEGFSESNPMPAGQRPGNSSSPFNQPVGPAPQVLPSSAAMVAFLLADHTPGSPMPENDTTPGGGSRPLYYAANSDPLVELVATEPWGNNPLTGRKIRVPQTAVAEQAGDGHLTIVLAPNNAIVPGEMVDLWQAQPVKEGKLLFSWGGPGNMTGTLLQPQGPSADAANFDLEAGQVRGPELNPGSSTMRSWWPSKT